MKVSVMSLVGLVFVAGCASETDEEERSSKAGTELSGGVYASAEFAKQTGVLLIWNGCTAARVGPRHVLTAAHCTGDYVSGTPLWITQRPSDNTSDWTETSVKKVSVHPSWAAVATSCGGSLVCSRTKGAADVAVIETTRELPGSIRSARVSTSHYDPEGYRQRVWVMGYGCENGLRAPTPPVRNLGAALLTIEPVSDVNRYGNVVNEWDKGLFNATYLLTPGMNNHKYGASLCPGDSGGPVVLDKPAYPGGPGYATNIVVGINADYTFDETSGYSTFNVHTRLSDEIPHFVGSWLGRILPPSSFVHSHYPE